MELYVKIRDGEVHSTTCVGSLMTAEFDAEGGIIGYEIVGAIALEVDGNDLTGYITEIEGRGTVAIALPETAGQSD